MIAAADCCLLGLSDLQARGNDDSGGRASLHELLPGR